jgi:hypothetical protein
MELKMFPNDLKTISFVFASIFLVVAMSASTVTTVKAADMSTVPKIMTKKYSWEMDSSAMLSKSDFKISPSKLIERAKEVIDKQVGLMDESDIAEDFVFQFPVVGPLTKRQYIDAVRGFKLTDAFPDYNPGYCDFRVDPLRPNRVWYTTCFSATHSGETKMFGKPTGKYVECPPQTMSLTFNEDGQVIKYTGGYVMDRTLGNSGGMGGIFGPLYAIGKGLPFYEAQPYKKSWGFYILSAIGDLAAKFSVKK